MSVYFVAGSDRYTLLTIIDSFWEGKQIIIASVQREMQVGLCRIYFF